MIRRQATAKAEEVKERRHQRLVSYLAELPAEMTSDELRTLFLDDYCRQLDVTRRSFFLRVQRRNLLRFDAAQGRWLNLAKLLAYDGH